MGAVDAIALTAHDSACLGCEHDVLHYQRVFRFLGLGSSTKVSSLGSLMGVAEYKHIEEMIMIERDNFNLFRQAVREESIDWLFCVELNACHGFQKWVRSKLFPELKDHKHIGAWRSIRKNYGETDILWCVESPDGRRLFALIENKIDAVAQKEQAVRYKERGNDYVEQKECTDFVTALIAPSEYISPDSELYDVRISYEDIIRDYLLKEGDKRSVYLASLYESVIKPKAATDEEMTSFRRSIWQLADAEFKQLCIKDPGKVIYNQNWVEWWPFGGGSGCHLLYKMDGQNKKPGKFADGCVMDLQIAGKYGKNVEDVKAKYQKALAGTGFTVTQPDILVVFRLQVPYVKAPFFDEEAVRAALQAAMRLKEWWEEWGMQKTLPLK